MGGGLTVCNLEMYSSTLDHPNDVRTTIIQRLEKHKSARLVKQV